ncbi:MAG: hypothetical protein JSR80_01125 [Verrucomicrobia bacterium]|nr:hypothetical protein [Verrucomicrobiota bacterium]
MVVKTLVAAPLQGTRELEERAKTYLRRPLSQQKSSYRRQKHRKCARLDVSL